MAAPPHPHALSPTGISSRPLAHKGIDSWRPGRSPPVATYVIPIGREAADLSPLMAFGAVCAAAGDLRDPRAVRLSRRRPPRATVRHPLWPVRGPSCDKSNQL